MRLFFLGLVVGLSWMGRLGVSAQLPQAVLTTIFPAGAQAGSTIELTVSGTDLDEPAGLLFSDPRVTASLKPGAGNQFEIVAPAEVPEGVVDVRFVGRFGISNSRAFAIGTRPELIAASTNTSSANAFDAPVETTVNGRVTPKNVSWFRFAAQAGQRLLIRVQARELDSRLVPNLMVTDATGRELASARGRPWLDFAAPAEGHYLLKLSDQMFRGGDDYHFRLTISAAPRIDFALPNVLRAGETNQVTLFGRNLPGGQPSGLLGRDGTALEQIPVEIVAPQASDSARWVGQAPSPVPAGASPAEFPSDRVIEHLRKPAAAVLLGEAFSWRLQTGSASSNPLLFALSTNAVFAARSNQVANVTPPCEYSAFFPAPGEISGVSFEAHKGDVFWLELFADRLGFPSDPHGVVQRAITTNGETTYTDLLELGDTDANIGDHEFNTATRDASARFEVPETGAYRLLVRDLFNLAPGRTRYPYILKLRRESPDFRLVLLPMPLPRVGEDRKVHVQSAALRREQTMAFKVLAFRRDGFNGAIELSAANLPPDVSAAPTRIFAGQNVGILLLTAGANATAMTNALVVGTAAIGTGTVTRASALASVVWPVADFNAEYASARVSREAMISVITAEAAPITIAPADAKPVEVPIDGKLVVPLAIARRGEFQAAFNLKPAGHEALNNAKEMAVQEKGTNVTLEINLAESKLPAGTHTIWLQGSVTGKYRNNPEAVALAEAKLKEADQALASVSEADKPQAEERKKAAEARKKAAEEKAQPRDITLVVYSQPLIVTVAPPPPAP